MAKRNPGRNDPCYCGSGKKFKKCHWGQSAPPPRDAEIIEVPVGITFTTQTARKFDPRTAIMPLLLQHPATGALKALGTCFPIFSKQNIFLTAAHVLDDQTIDIAHRLDGSFAVRDGYNLVALWFQNPEEPQVEYFFRSVVRLWIREGADIAMGQLEGMTHKVTQSRLEDMSPIWDLRPPKTAELVSTYAYPGVRGTTEVVRRAHMTATARFGRVTKLWPNGRDRTLLPAPCFETDLDLTRGMSGGPVFNSDGRLCGINSTGCDLAVGERPRSSMSMLHPALDIRLWSSNDPDGLTVRELITRGFINVVNMPELKIGQ